MSDRILLAKEVSREGLVYDHHPWRAALQIGLSQHAASQKLHVQGLEKPGGDEANMSEFGPLATRTTIDGHSEVDAPSPHRNARARRRHLHPGDRTHAIHQLPERRLDRGRLGVAVR